MEILEVSKEEFDQIINKPYYLYGSGKFNHLNRGKSEQVCYLLFKEEKYRLGIVGGIKDGGFYSPFSAPFGGFVYLSDSVRINYIDSALELLIDWAKANKLKTISLILPPPIYNESFIAKQENCLYRKNFQFSKIDLNYHFLLERFDENYLSGIWENSRRNFKRALKQKLSFHQCENVAEKELAYNIIKKHMHEKEFPLKMSWEQVKETTELINADFFMVKTSEQLAVGATIIYKDDDGRNAQLIYWGDEMKYASLRTMNFLSYKIFEYYREEGYKMVDLGPSTEDSIPNYGLCSFKESLGCEISTKNSFILNL